MMIPSVLTPPSMMYPGLYHPAAALPLHHHHHPLLPSAYQTHSGFLVEDLLRISRPAPFVNRPTPPSVSAAPLRPTSTATVSMAGSTHATTRDPCSPKSSLPASKDPTFLKFGVSAILAPSPKTGK